MIGVFYSIVTGFSLVDTCIATEGIKGGDLDRVETTIEDTTLSICTVFVCETGVDALSALAVIAICTLSVVQTLSAGTVDTKV